MRIGIDLGGTSIKGGLVNDQGQVLYKDAVPTGADRPGEEIVASVATLIRQLLDTARIQVEDVECIGAGIPGTILPQAGVVEFANNFAFFRQMPFRDMLREHFPSIPIYINNDVNAAALGEATAGAARGYQYSMMVALGTGVGAGIIFNGHIYGGNTNAAGEIGHMLLKPEGEVCTCSRRGCFERYVSASALVRKAQAARHQHPDCILNQWCDASHPLDGRMLFAAYFDTDDPVVRVIIDQFIQDLSDGLVNMIYLYDPQMIVLGGGISPAVKKLMPQILDRTAAVIERNKVFTTRIEIAHLMNDAGIVGAAFLSEQGI